ncbi:MAG TPA: hypothetical protein VG939_09570 [Caulobacteraceae bacterium]|nr:hypothetical protein [Caulobacteraceae bacterium]
MFAATSAAGAPARYPQRVVFHGRVPAAETAAVRAAMSRTLGDEWTAYERTAGHPPSFRVGRADVDGDGRADLIAQVTDEGFGYCGSAGCVGFVILARSDGGWATQALSLTNFDRTLVVLRDAHGGMHDIRVDTGGQVLEWDGEAYQ